MQVFTAAQQGHTAVVVALVAAGAAVNQTQSACRLHASPLYIAAQHGHAGVVRALAHNPSLLLDQAVTSSGGTPLAKAAQKGHLAVVEALLDGWGEFEGTIPGS